MHKNKHKKLYHNTYVKSSDCICCVFLQMCHSTVFFRTSKHTTYAVREYNHHLLYVDTCVESPDTHTDTLTHIYTHSHTHTYIHTYSRAIRRRGKARSRGSCGAQAHQSVNYSARQTARHLRTDPIAFHRLQRGQRRNRYFFSPPSRARYLGTYYI